jgi:hypothetical protein
MNKRSDTHSPVNLVTENYEFVNAFDNQQPGWLMSDYAKEISQKVRQTPATGDRGMSQCHHCGAHIRYVAVMEHTPTGEYIAIGETCLDNRFDRATHVFQKLRKQAQLDREKQRIVKAREAFCLDNPDLAFLADTSQDTWPEAVKGNSFAGSLSWALSRYGNLTERQVEAIRPAIGKMIARHEEKLAEAAKPEAEKVPVPEGKVQITGTVKSTRWQESDFGGSLKMLVLADQGYKVWGTVPASLPNIKVGDRIVFSATVTAKAGEIDFGYFKRPTKGVFLSQKEEV